MRRPIKYVLLRTIIQKFLRAISSSHLPIFFSISASSNLSWYGDIKLRSFFHNTKAHSLLLSRVERWPWRTRGWLEAEKKVNKWWCNKSCGLYIFNSSKGKKQKKNKAAKRHRVIKCSHNKTLYPHDVHNELMKATANVKLIPFASSHTPKFSSHYRALLVTCIMKIKWKWFIKKAVYRSNFHE